MVLVSVVLLAVGCSETESGPTGASDAARAPLVGITWGANVTWAMKGGALVRVDPLSLRPRSAPRIQLGDHGYSWASSPDRSSLVLGGFGSLRFVDLNRFEPVGDARAGARRNGLVVAVLWPTPRLVLAVVQEPYGSGRLSLASVDPLGRTVSMRPVFRPASVVSARTSKLGLALLLAPATTVGAATLLFIEPRGRTRALVLDRVLAGAESIRRGSRFVSRQWRPALALDEHRRRAFVAAGASPVAEIDLHTLRVTYHEPAALVSLFGRLRNWLEPQAQAKGEVEGPVREAQWLGRDLLAVSGFDARGLEPSRASGLRVIDTRRWTVRTLDGNAADFVPANGLLLAYGCCFRTGDKAFGLTAYDRAGRTVWHLFGRRPIHAVQVSGARAYVRLDGVPTGRRPPWVAVVDTRRGKVLRTLQTPWTQLLLPRESSMAEKEG